MFVSFAHRLLFSLLAVPVFMFSSSVWSQEAGRGATADFEVEYLEFIIDHHFAALRLTEIAAGTAEIRQAEISNEEGVSPTPGTEALQGRAEREEVRSLARKVNNRDREEILIAQRFLREWYGIEYSPQLSAEDEAVLQELEQVEAGGDFDQRFLEALARHHYRGTIPTVNCIVGRDIAHDQLFRFCKGILELYLLEIEDMRELLFTEYGLADFQPFAVPEANGDNGATEDTAIPAGNGVGNDARPADGDTAVPIGRGATDGAGASTGTGATTVVGAGSLTGADPVTGGSTIRTPAVASTGGIGTSSGIAPPVGGRGLDTGGSVTSPGAGGPAGTSTQPAVVQSDAGAD